LVRFTPSKLGQGIRNFFRIIRARRFSIFGSRAALGMRDSSRSANNKRRAVRQALCKREQKLRKAAVYDVLEQSKEKDYGAVEAIAAEICQPPGDGFRQHAAFKKAIYVL
jgi:hypothetical protein